MARPRRRAAERERLIAQAAALAEGTGLFLVLGGAGSAAMVALALAATLVREAAREAYRRGLVRDHAPAGTLAWFARRETRVLHALRWLAALLLLAALSGLAGGAGWLLAALGGAIAAATGWALKAILITRAAYTRGARIPQTPARGRGNASPVLPFPLPGHGRR